MSTTSLSYHRLIAMYFALCAARKGTTKVFISNQNLRSYFIGNRKGERLSEKQLTDFANSLKPVFPRSSVKRGTRGPLLVLYLNEKAKDLPTKPISVWFLNEA